MEIKIYSKKERYEIIKNKATEAGINKLVVGVLDSEFIG